MHRLGGQASAAYGPRRAAYDLKKLRGKQLLRRLDGTRRYELVPAGIKALAAVVVLRDHVIKPVLAAVEHATPAPRTQQPTALDRHYDALRVSMYGVFHELGVAA